MAQKRLTRAQFLERLLAIMDRKHHWAWPIIMGPGISKAQLKIHYQQEYLVYVRDFPVLLARVHGQNPPPDVRRMLAENIYEEDTGGLSFGRSHPELFNEMMRANQIHMLPADPMVTNQRMVIDIGFNLRICFRLGRSLDLLAVLDAALDEYRQCGRADEPVPAGGHLVQPSPVACAGGKECDSLERVAFEPQAAHQKVEAGHRQDAYAMVVGYAENRRQQHAVLACVSQGLTLWTKYRDAVAKACNLKKP